MVFLQKKILAQFSYKQCFHNTFKVVDNFARVFSCNFFTKLDSNKTYMKHTQSLKLLLATVAKSSCVAKF